ncbi:hypothetical protein [Phormidium tenue]|jgi:hypothetical protein|uniref:Uncharacterized protein n=1 Tax=Phormidium tenue FACHB-1050 TaxID=2692857 RepID=A0ABR8CG04_9CYAN|nr:hypothetical protein [Phormidium tenue]MBD2319728.1 hypothetical protein [Phormidium tenue FACHB-1050]
MREPTIQAVQLDDDTTIYVEVRQPATFADDSLPEVKGRELSREDLGGRC